jgi:hypothetical protein
MAEEYMIDDEVPQSGGTLAGSQKPIDYWQNMNQAPTGYGGPSGYPAYGTPEYYKYFFGMDPAQSQDIIDKQQQGQEEFAAGEFGGPMTGAPTDSAASDPNREGSAWKSAEQIAAEQARDAEQQNSYYADSGGGGGAAGGGGSASGSISGGSNYTPEKYVAPQWQDLGPTKYTPGEDQMLDTLMQRMTQGTQIDRNDPNIQQQVDPYAAQQERARRNAVSDYAERAGATASGAQRGQERMMAERAGQNVGMFEAELVGKELQNRRDEIRHALDSMGALVSEDQRRQLQAELANLDSQLKTMGISSAEKMGAWELGLKDRLGTAGLNLDLMRMLLQNQQWGDEFGLNVGDREAYWNNIAFQNMLR